MPIGTANSDPSPVKISVPTMALAMPPPVSPTGFGIFVKKSRLSDEMPWLTTKNKHERERHERDQHRQARRSRRTATTASLRRRSAVGVMRPPRQSAARRLTTGAVDASRAMLQISSRDSELTISVMTKSTRPISTSAFRYSSVSASVNSLAITAAIVYCGANSDAEILGLLPITIVTAIVSPSARPKPSMTAPTMPVRA